MSENMLFRSDRSGEWEPDPHARGGYDGVQGGVVAALLCAVAERQIGAELEPRALTVHFFRTVPLDRLRVDIDVVHRGKRSAVCDTRVLHGDKLHARASVTFAADFHVASAPLPQQVSTDPRQLEPLPKFTSLHGQPWHDQIMDRAKRSDDEFWYRSDWRVIGGESSFARILPFADWTPASARPDDWRQPAVRALPNVEFSAHADRLPASDWIGMRPMSRWSRSGTGFCSTTMADLHGEFGRFSTTLILIP